MSVFRPYLSVIRFIGVIIPRRLRATWRSEWEAELKHREIVLADWEALTVRSRMHLLWQALGAFRDAIFLQTYRWEDEMIQDLRFGLRMLVRNKTSTIVAVLSLALGIGANTAIFSAVDRLLLRSMTVIAPERLVTLAVTTKNGSNLRFTYPDYSDYRDQNQVFKSLACFNEMAVNITVGGATTRANGMRVSANFFDTIGRRPAVGRSFLSEEERIASGASVAIISSRLWERSFARDAQIVGKQVLINGEPFDIVGVNAADFSGAIHGYEPDVYLPLIANPSRNFYPFLLLGRLKEGVSTEQAQASMTVLGGGIARLYPNPDGQPRQPPVFILADGSRGHTFLTDGLVGPLRMLLGIAALVLLIACANVANLLLARAAARRREIAIRMAIGAGRNRLVRQLVTESLLLAFVGGLAGLALVPLVTNLMNRFAPPGNTTPIAFAGGIDLRVLAFCVGLSFVCGVVFGIIPALTASRVNLVAPLKGAVNASVPRGVSLRKVLVMAQVAVSCLVLVGAGLCIRSLQKLRSIDSGFDTESVVVFSTDLAPSRYDATRGQLFYQQLLSRLSSMPGVDGVALSNRTPLGDVSLSRRTAVEGYEPQPGENMSFQYNVVTPGYFQTMRIPLVSGRDFSAADAADKPQVIIVSESIARRYWPDGKALGRTMLFGAYAGSPIPLQRLEVIGIVKDSKYLSLTEDNLRMMFLPLAQSYRAEMRTHIRTRKEAPSLLPAIRAEVARIDSGVPLFNIRTLEEQRDQSLYASRLAATLLTVFGAVALLLASVGIYGVMSYFVGQRRREMAIRLALGATSSHVFGRVLKEGMSMVAAGVLVGIVAAVLATRLLRTLLYGVSPTDIPTFVGIVVTLMAVALLANWLPARRASRVAPMTALRNE